MIADTFDRLPFYRQDFPWDLMRDFLAKVDDAMPAGRVSLDGERLYVGLDRYDARPATACVLESHRRYIDVQLLLSGTEIIRVYDTSRLTVAQAYDAKRDVAFYEAGEDKSPVAAEVVMTPGRACMLFLEDAHMPGVAVAGASSGVVKVVFKVAAESW